MACGYLEVAMHDALRVHVGDALDELLKVDTSNVLVELALGHCVDGEHRQVSSIDQRENGARG